MKEHDRESAYQAPHNGHALDAPPDSDASLDSPNFRRITQLPPAQTHHSIPLIQTHHLPPQQMHHCTPPSSDASLDSPWCRRITRLFLVQTHHATIAVSDLSLEAPDQTPIPDHTLQRRKCPLVYVYVCVWGVAV